MKVSKLAVAIAVASISVSAQAFDLKISGDFNVGYLSSNKSINEKNSELNFDVSTDKVRGLTFMAHTELDIDTIFTSGSDEPYFDEVRAGVKGAFGEVWFGDQDNACSKLQKGGDYHKFINVSSQGCKGETEGTLLYMKPIGKAKVGISHNPNIKNSDSDSRATETAVGIQYKVNKKTTLAAGYVRSSDKNYASVSGTTGVGPWELKFRVRDDGGSDEIEGSIQSKYKFGNHAVYGSYERDADGDTMWDNYGLGYMYSFGRSSFRVEALDDNDKDVAYAVGISTEWK